MGNSWDKARLPYEYVNSNYSFTVFESGSNIKMYAPEIILYPGTIVEKGAECLFSN